MMRDTKTWRECTHTCRVTEAHTEINAHMQRHRRTEVEESPPHTQIGRKSQRSAHSYMRCHVYSCTEVERHTNTTCRHMPRGTCIHTCRDAYTEKEKHAHRQADMDR
jgi:hypothetical protein